MVVGVMDENDVDTVELEPLTAFLERAPRLKLNTGLRARAPGKPGSGGPGRSSRPTLVEMVN